MPTSRPALGYARSVSKSHNKTNKSKSRVESKSPRLLENQTPFPVPYYSNIPMSNAEWYPCVAKIKIRNSNGDAQGYKFPLAFVIVFVRKTAISRALLPGIMVCSVKGNVHIHCSSSHGRRIRHRVFLITIPPECAQACRCTARLLSQHTGERERCEGRCARRSAVSWRAVVLRRAISS